MKIIFVTLLLTCVLFNVVYSAPECSITSSLEATEDVLRFNVDLTFNYTSDLHNQLAAIDSALKEAFSKCVGGDVSPDPGDITEVPHEEEKKCEKCDDGVAVQDFSVAHSQLNYLNIITEDRGCEFGLQDIYDYRNRYEIGCNQCVSARLTAGESPSIDMACLRNGVWVWRGHSTSGTNRYYCFTGGCERCAIMSRSDISLCNTTRSFN